MRPGAARSPHARARRRTGSSPPDAPLAQLVPSGPEQVDDTVQALLVSGCFMAQRAHPRRHALLHSRRDPADGADAGGAPRRADRPRPAAPLEPPPRRRRPAPAAARPRRRRRAALVRRRSCCTPRSVVIDDQLALAGSANLDLRSLFLNYELMVAFYEPADVAPLRRLDRARARRRRPLRAEGAGAPARPLRGPAALARVPALARRSDVQVRSSWLALDLGAAPVEHDRVPAR